jgi:uncharacterized membrane protein
MNTTHRTVRRGMPEAPASRRRGSRGSIIVNTAIALSLIVITLIGTEIGYMYFMKREFQKTADLAALAGAQQIRNGCTAASAAAQSNANGASVSDSSRNMPLGFSLAAGEVQCGYWDRVTSFQTPAVTGAANAVRVSFQKQTVKLLPFFDGNRTVSVSAVAALSAPLAEFSVGSKLVAVTGDSLLGRALKGIGLDLAGSLAGYDGLAQVNVTPAGLLEALGLPISADIGVAELNALLNANTVTLGKLLDATIKAANVGNDLLASNITLLNAIQAKLGLSELNVPLGSLLQITSPNGPAGAALNVGINALDILTTGIGIATQKHAIAVNSLGVANLVKARVALIEPPSIGVGGVGAVAYTGQLRTYVQIDTGNVPIVGSLVRLKLPIMIDAVNGKGTLTQMCTPELKTAGGVDRARIDVQASILKVCVGKPGADPAKEDEIFSTSASCDTNLQNEQLLNVGLLGINLVSLNTKLKIDALPLPVNSYKTLAQSETGTLGNDLLLGTTVSNITNALLASLLANSLSQSPALTDAQRQAMATDLWGTPPCGASDSACRKARLTTVNNKITSAANGLGGFLGNLGSDTVNILNQLLTLNLAGLVSGVLTLVGGLLSGVGSVLSGILGGLFGNDCTGGGIFGATGADAGCVSEIANSLKNSSGSGSTSTPNAVIALVGFLLQLLQPILDTLGTQILTPLLQNVLGLHLGQVDINLRTLDCNASPSLVY